MSQSRWRTRNRWLEPSLVLTLILGIAEALQAGGPAPQASSAGPASASGTAYDYFTTVAAQTAFDFTGDFALPAGFFDSGSARFAGRVPFKGAPLGTYEGREVGNADTVVARTGMPNLGPPFPSRGTAELELVALSLASTRPIRVAVGKKVQLWDVTVQLSSHRPPRGKMTIVQKSAKGGTFDSDFTVYPLITFVRRGDGARRVVDAGTLKLGPESGRQITLHGRSLPWATQAPNNVVSSADSFHAGVSQDKKRPMIFHKFHTVETAVLTHVN
jgi:hypothetical protein